jgi:dTDP-4-dehydrorhamnose reductase
MILVTGSNGMVGSYVKEIFDKKQLYLTDVNSLDIRQADRVMKEIVRVNPEFVLHLAAKTDVDRCEIEVDDAYLTNCLGTQNIALACQKTGAIMIYVSTACVFRGDNIKPYTEFDLPDPINIYGKTKWEGEKIVSSLLNRYYIIRSAWLMGGKKEDKKFVGKMIRLFEKNEKIFAVDDIIGSPTYVKDLLEGIKSLISTGYYGLYHIANKGICSRYDMAVEIGKILKKKNPIEPVPSAFFPLHAARGRSEAMRNYKAELLNLVKMRNWQDALREYLES